MKFSDIFSLLNRQVQVSNATIQRLSIGFLFCMVSLMDLSAQIDTVWVRCFGGSQSDELLDIIKAADGGYILTGYSFESEHPNAYPQTDVMIVKISTNGDLIWQKKFGGSKYDMGYSAAEDAQGNIFVYARTFSSDGDVTDHKGGSDNWLLQLNKDGNLINASCFGSPQNDGQEAGNISDSLHYNDNGKIRLTPDGNLIWLGTYRAGNIIYHWIVEMTNNFDLLSEAKIPGSFSNKDLIVLSDGSYVFAALEPGSLNGDYGDYRLYKKKNDDPNGGFDTVLKFPEKQVPWSLCPTSDGGFYIAGYWDNAPGKADMWWARFDANGNYIPSKSNFMRGDSADYAFVIRPTPDGGYLIGGATWSTNGICRAFYSSSIYDAYVLRTDANGQRLWQTNIGGNGYEDILGIVVEDDSTFVVAGTGNSSDGPQACSAKGGGSDFWVVKFRYSCQIRMPHIIGPPLAIADSTVRLYVKDSLQFPDVRYFWTTPMIDTVTENAFLIISKANKAMHEGIYSVKNERQCCFSSPSPSFELVISSTSTDFQDCGNWILTPNGDGQNDTFEPYCLIGLDVTLKIFNLWGKCVFEADQYNLDWDGTSEGLVIPEGTYLYQALVKDDGQTYRGTIDIRK